MHPFIVAIVALTAARAGARVERIAPTLEADADPTTWRGDASRLNRIRRIVRGPAATPRPRHEPFEAATPRPATRTVRGRDAETATRIVRASRPDADRPQAEIVCAGELRRLQEECEDSLSWRKNGVESRDCQWVALKPSIRCVNDAEDECPHACEECGGRRGNRGGSRRRRGDGVDRPRTGRRDAATTA